MEVLFTNLGSQLGLILTIIGIVSAIGGFWAYLIHHPASSKDKWKVIGGVVGLIILGGVVFAAISLWPKHIVSHVQQGSPGILIYTDHSHGDEINGLAWSPDGNRLASGSSDGTIQVWDATTREHRLIHHDVFISTPSSVSPVGKISWSPDGKYIASGTLYTIQLWNASTGDIVRTITSSNITDLAWSPDGKYIAFTSGTTVHIWDVTAEREHLTYHSNVGVRLTLTWSADSRFIASGGFGGVDIWSTVTGQRFQTINCNCDHVGSLTWSPSGRFITLDYSYFNPDGIDQKVEVIDNGNNPKKKSIYETEMCYSGMPSPSTGVLNVPYMFVTWSPNSRYIAFNCFKRIYIWDSTNQHDIFALEAFAPVNAIAWSPDGNYIATGGLDGTVQLWQEADYG